MKRKLMFLLHKEMTHRIVVNCKSGQKPTIGLLVANGFQDVGVAVDINRAKEMRKLINHGWTQ